MSSNNCITTRERSGRLQTQRKKREREVGGSMACRTPVRLPIYPAAASRARKSVVIKMKRFPRENGRFASSPLLFARQGVSQAGR